jgi:hypothetical protein
MSDAIDTDIALLTDAARYASVAGYWASYLYAMYVVGMLPNRT